MHGIICLMSFICMSGSLLTVSVFINAAQYANEQSTQSFEHLHSFVELMYLHSSISRNILTAFALFYYVYNIYLSMMYRL